MARIHRTTHPVLGPSTWKEMQEAQKAISASRGFPVCTWCHNPVPQGARTRCSNRACHELIWQAQSWNRCQRVKLRKEPICPCGHHSEEVDHIIPVSLGGTGDQINLRGLCTDCHKEATRLLRKMGDKYVAVNLYRAKAPQPLRRVF